LKRYFSVVVLAMLLPHLAVAAVTCPGGGTANQYGFCGLYSVPQIACQSKTANGCSEPKGSANIGFYTVGAGTGTAGAEFPGIGYSNFSGSPAYDTPNANGAVGQKQVLEFVNSGIQAYSKATGSPIFVKKGATTPTPQAPSRPWAAYSGSPLTAACGNLSIDVNATYDHPDGVFILSAISNSSSKNTPSICIAASTQDNLEGTGGNSYWNAYGFALSSIVATDGPTNAYFDYPRFGTFGNHFYLAVDYIDNTKTSPDYQHILGYAVCLLDKTDIVAGKPAANAQCAVYLPVRSSGFDSLVHSLLPADTDSTTVAPGTQGEFFIGQVNPTATGTSWTQGSPCYESYACADSAQLLLWTWEQISTGAQPTLLSQTFMPGCYNPFHPSDTFCVPQPSPATSAQVLDGLSDRVSGRLAYSYASGLDSEILAATNTIWNGITSNENPQQTVQFSIFTASPGSFPVLASSGDFAAPDDTWSAWTASVAINSVNNIGLTFTEDDSGVANPMPPSIYSTELTYNSSTSTWNAQSPSLVVAGTGVSTSTGSSYIPDWGNYVSLGLDPSDELTFWGVNEYLTENQTPSALTWQSEIFNF
jgi:hypothetical protein